MSRTAAKVTQADVARALRAMKAAGFCGKVQIRPDGTIEIVPLSERDQPRRFDDKREIVL
jgi:hypothetical protein